MNAIIEIIIYTPGLRSAKLKSFLLVIVLEQTKRMLNYSKTKPIIAFILLFLAFDVTSVFSQASVLPDTDGEQNIKEEFVMPEYLNGNTFHEQVSKNLTVVEFFSPYCSHCKTLAPVWKDVVEAFMTTNMGVEYKIDFRQVDCIQSGDICSNENIPAYPLIRLYGPSISGFETDVDAASEFHLQNYPSDFKKNKQDIIKFAKLESLNYYSSANNLEGNVDDAVSHVAEEIPLSNDELISIISDVDVTTGEEMKENENSWVIALINEKSNKAEKKWWTEDRFFKNNWGKLGKTLQAHSINLGTFNCHQSSNAPLREDICSELISNSDEFPQLLVVTPKKKINKIFQYDKKNIGGFSIAKIVDFAVRVTQNSYIPKINSMDLNTFVSSRSEKLEPLKRDEKIYFVFQYDEETVTAEDFDFLEHLILPLSSIPNFYMYQAKQDLEKFNLRLLEKLNNKLERENLITDYSENMFTNKLLSQVPTFHIYKENSMIPSTYRCFSTVDLRNVDMVLDWVYKDSLPSIIEVKDTNADLLFNYNKDCYEQVALLFLDSSETADVLSAQLNAYRKNFEAYELSRWNYQYEVLNSERKYKEDKIEMLRNEVTGSDKHVLFKEMKKEILLNDFEKRALFAFVDISKYPLDKYSFLHVALAGFSEVEEIESGNILVIDNGKFSKGQVSVFQHVVVDNEDEKELLTLEGFEIANLLSYINFKKTLVEEQSEKSFSLKYQTISPNLYIRSPQSGLPSQKSAGIVIILVLAVVLVVFVLKGKVGNRFIKKSNFNYLMKLCLQPLRIFGITITPNGSIRFSGYSNKSNKSKLTYNNIGILSKPNKPID